MHAPSDASNNKGPAQQRNRSEWADAAPPLSWSRHSMSRPASFRRHY